MKNSKTSKLQLGAKFSFSDKILDKSYNQKIYEIYSIRDQHDPKLYFWNVNDKDDQLALYSSTLLELIMEEKAILLDENKISYVGYFGKNVDYHTLQKVIRFCESNNIYIETFERSIED